MSNKMMPSVFINTFNSASELSFVITALVFLLLPLCGNAETNMVDLRLSFPEEQPPGTKVGDIKSLLRLQRSRDDLDFSRYMFNPLNYQEKYFLINKETGEITVRNQIDREKLCDELGTCCPGGNPSCKMTMTIALVQKDTPSIFKEILQIDAEIIDINDNAPGWNTRVLVIEIPEHTPITSKFRLLPASDPDKSPENTTQKYDLRTGNDKFRIDMERSSDPATPPELWLQVLADLDREIRPYHELQIFAIDGSSVPLTGSVIINVTLLDINDHSPEWIHNRKIIEIPENYPRNREIFKVEAKDADSSDKGNLLYKFSVSASESLRKLFSINPRTGSIIAIHNLDYETQKEYKLPIMVTDGKHPVETVLIIRLTNENDNPPKISINNYKGTGGFEIRENADVGSIIATMDVTDEDDKLRTQAISCFIEPSKDFGILPLYDKAKQQFKIVSNVKFDREMQAHYSATITCNDNGSPNKQDASTIHISIIDENDCPPVFLKNPLFVRLKENNNIHPPQFVARMDARDNDTNQNALIRYSIDQISEQYFAIDSRSGVIKAKVSFDRERDHYVNITVYARDLGNEDSPLNAKTATGTVFVEIEDENDCAPEFHPKHYTFTVRENVNRRTSVGKVSATDRDIDAKNRNIVFRMYNEDGSKESQISYSDFLVTRDGEILTNTDNLDRERRATYQFLVVADDQAGKSDTAQVVVQVLDENDNSPIWIYPTDTNKKINVSIHETTGYKIAQLHATDPDEGLNGTITYKLENRNPSNNLFKVSSEGDLYLARPISIDKDSKILHKLLLNASDQGQPCRYSIKGLDVLIVENSKNYISSSRTSENNLIIIICMVVITLVISLFLIAAIFFLRCNNCGEFFRPRGNRDKRFQQNQYASAHSFSAGGTLRSPDMFGENQYKVQLPLSPLDVDKRNMIVTTDGKVLLDDSDSLDSGKGCSSDNGATMNRSTMKITKEGSIPIGIDSKRSNTLSFTAHTHSRSNPQTMSTFRYSNSHERMGIDSEDSPTRNPYQNLRDAKAVMEVKPDGGRGSPVVHFQRDGYTSLQRDDSGNMLTLQQRVQSPVPRAFRHQPTSFV